MSKTVRTVRTHRKRLSWATVAAAMVAGIVFAIAGASFGAVSTDQADYSPGSVVTISGGNDAAGAPGYTAGNSVSVDATADNGLWEQTCSATVADDGTWSCRVTLSSDPSIAVGSYHYTASSTDAGGNPIGETGTFTDNANVSIGSATFAWHRTGEVANGFDVSVSGGYTCNTSGQNCTTVNGISVTVPGLAGSVTAALNTTSHTWSATLHFRTSGGDFTIPADDKYNVTATLDTNLSDQTATSNTYFGVDNTSPTTTITCNATTCGSTYSADVSVQLHDSDGPASSSSGVPNQGANIVYCVDTANACTPSTAYPGGAGFTVTYTAGATKYVRFHSTDTVGNVETTKSQAIVFSSPNPFSVSAGGPYSGDEGSDIPLTGSVGNGGTNPHYSWSIDTTGGDSGISCQITDASTPTPSVNCNDDSNGGTFTLTLSYYDGAHGSPASPITDTAQLTVGNVAPVVTLSGSNTYTYGESTSVERTFDYTVADAGSNDTLSVSSVSCGSGGSVASDNSNTLDASGNGTLTCIFPDGPATPTISVTAQDDDGGTSIAATHSVTVENVAPTLGALSFSGVSSVACIGGNSVTVGSIGWTDPAEANDEPFSVSIDWGDGDTRTFSAINAFTLADKSHSYPVGGPYTISVTVTDKDNGTSAAVTDGPFSFLYNMSGILAPFNSNGSSVWKWGSTIPVKVQITDCNGQPVSGLAPKVGTSLVSSADPSISIDETQSTSAADTTGIMRYDPTAGQYIYNFGSKYLSDPSATYYMTVKGTDSNGNIVTSPPMVQQKFGLKSK